MQVVGSPEKLYIFIYFYVIFPLYITICLFDLTNGVKCMKSSVLGSTVPYQVGVRKAIEIQPCVEAL